MWAGVAVSFCFLVFRFYVRLRIFRRLHVEDPFVLAAWLMNLVNTVIWQKTANELYSVIAVESGQLPMPRPEYFSHVYIELHSLFAAEFLYYTALWSVKLSFLLFFRKLGNCLRRQMILWYCVLAFTIASYVGCLCMMDYRCLVGPRDLGKHSSSLRECGLIYTLQSGLSKCPRRSLCTYPSLTSHRIRHYNGWP